MIEKTGSVFDTHAGALGHGVNCVGAMGAGVARLVRQRWPQMFEPYRQACVARTLRPGDVLPMQTGEEPIRWVYHLATQGRPGPDARLEWIRQSAQQAAVHARQHGIERIAIPQIGCGIGGLAWSDVRPVLLSLEDGVEWEIWTL